MNKMKANTIIDIVIFILMGSMFVTKGELHETLAYILGAMIVTHLVLHWAQFKTMFKKLVPNVKAQVAVGALIAALAAAILLMPAYLDMGDHEGHEGRKDRGFGPPPGHNETLNTNQK